MGISLHQQRTHSRLEFQNGKQPVHIPRTVRSPLPTKLTSFVLSTNFVRIHNKWRLLRVTWQDRGTHTSCAPGKLERQLEESERSRMELERFVRLEWPRTENESRFLSIPCGPSIPVPARCLAHHCFAQRTLRFKPQHDVILARAPQTFLSSNRAYARVCKTSTGWRSSERFLPPHQLESPSSAQPLESPHSRPAYQSRRTLRVPQASRRAPGTLHSETVCSEQTLRNRRV